MNKNVLPIIGLIIIILLGIYFLVAGRARTDVYLKDFDIDEKSNVMTIKVGVSSSFGYVRDFKIKQGGDNKYITFYSAFGINFKIGAKDTFKRFLNNSASEIYFYTGEKRFKKVLEKDESTGNWGKVNE